MMNNLLAGGIGGVAARVGGNFNATWGPGVGLAATGLVMKNPTLQTLAGMNLGNAIAGTVMGGGAGTGGSGGWY
jgi:hypothetical protein